MRFDQVGNYTRITTATTTNFLSAHTLLGLFIVATVGTIEIQDGDGTTIVSDVAGTGWVDLPIYSKNGFKVVTSAADEVIVVTRQDS